ncbi:MAG: 2-dehydro-3-deoxyphosphogluconate aldolase [Actinomycetota bacterium]|nr:2-dehydro-3-deoxyphosphogluconate aldolase [Actinomycetota bacterium]
MSLPELIAVVRSETLEECRTTVRGLVAAGVPGIEVTMTVPGGVAVLEEVAGGPAVVGAGTVLDVASAEACLAAGAAFLVSPVTDAPVHDVARSAGVPYVGGALTATEIVAALRLGIRAVKLFPISSVGGARYVRAVREPFPELEPVVSGGVEAADVRAYRAAGAVAVCMGGALVDRAAARRGDVEAVAARARLVLATIGEGSHDA